VLELPDVALVMVDNIAPELACMSLAESCSRVKFGSVHVWTDRPNQYTNCFPNHREIHFRYFAGNTLTDVARVLWEKLPDAIANRFALIQQWDSWVLDTSAWRDDFLKYDYIGAPWGWHDVNQVGNGGFSLRSMRLIRFVKGHNLWNMQNDDGSQMNEDEAVCRHNRHLIDPHFTIPGAMRASQFAFERTHYRAPGEHFGFHGLFNFKTVLSDHGYADRMALVYANDHLRIKPEAIHERMREGTDRLDTKPSNAVA
jgi:hypothetical protein